MSLVVEQQVEVRRRAVEPTVTVELEVNGTAVVVEVPARTSLADLLRDHLGLTATHLGCEQGVCGSCTVLVNGASTRACLFLAVQAAGTSVITVEGLSPPDMLNDVQAALVEACGIQCGFCTPGFVVTLTEMVGSGRIAAMDDDALRRELDGNLCRCTGYVGVLAAARTLAERVRRAPDPGAHP